MPDARKELGQKGEQLAAEFFIGQGYQELGRNLRFKQGEIDLLMRDGDCIVLVEVKTQTQGRLIDPVYKISPLKYRKLSLLAQIIAAKYPEQNIRIDAFTLYWEHEAPHFNHYINI